MTNEGVPVSPPSSSGAGDGTAHGQTGSRYFDPKTDVDVRKRDTQKVLSQFMKVGGFGQPEPAAKG
jgi:glycogenin glucosyltransferase